MNSTKTNRFPTAIPVAQIRHKIHTFKWLLHLVLCLLGLQASAQNLIVNGDFESGQMIPWTGGQLWPNPSGGMCARVGDLVAGDAIGQTVATSVGQSYLLSADLRSEGQVPAVFTITAQAQTGDIENSREVAMQGAAFQRFTMLFTASAAQTFLDLRGNLGQFVLIDNVSVIPVPPASADKSYTGMMVTTVTVSDPAMSTKSSRKVTARINAAGDIILLDGTEGIITGSILPTGGFSLILPGNVTVNGTATVRGRRIILEYISGSHAAVNAHGESVPNTIKQSLTLTRR